MTHPLCPDGEGHLSCALPGEGDGGHGPAGAAPTLADLEAFVAEWRRLGTAIREKCAAARALRLAEATALETEAEALVRERLRLCAGHPMETYDWEHYLSQGKPLPEERARLYRQEGS